MGLIMHQETDSSSSLKTSPRPKENDRDNLMEGLERHASPAGTTSCLEALAYNTTLWPRAQYFSKVLWSVIRLCNGIGKDHITVSTK